MFSQRCSSTGTPFSTIEMPGALGMKDNINSAIGRLPNFLIIGAAKSGTTTMYEYMLQHPEVYMPVVKEPCFFDEAMTWKNGIGWYMSLFAEAKEHQICGEASTNYTRWPQVRGVPEKIKAVAPDAKLIYVMRDPIKRAYSHYIHRWSKELHRSEPVSMGFMEFVTNDPMCIDSSKYNMQIQEYLKFFPLNQMLLVVFENLIENPNDVMNQVFRFLNLDLISVSQTPVKANSSDEYLVGAIRAKVAERFRGNALYNAARLLLPPGLKTLLYDYYASKTVHYKEIESQFSFPPLTKSEREYLKSIFLPHNNELRDAYGVDISKWC